MNKLENTLGFSLVGGGAGLIVGGLTSIGYGFFHGVHSSIEVMNSFLSLQKIPENYLDSFMEIYNKDFVTGSAYSLILGFFLGGVYGYFSNKPELEPKQNKKLK